MINRVYGVSFDQSQTGEPSPALVSLIAMTVCGVRCGSSPPESRQRPPRPRPPPKLRRPTTWSSVWRKRNITMRRMPSWCSRCGWAGRGSGTLRGHALNDQDGICVRDSASDPYYHRHRKVAAIKRSLTLFGQPKLLISDDTRHARRCLNREASRSRSAPATRRSCRRT
jgi:hypothetical protein